MIRHRIDEDCTRSNNSLKYCGITLKEVPQTQGLEALSLQHVRSSRLRELNEQTIYLSLIYCAKN